MQCTCICGISSPPCLLLYIHSGYVFLCAFACTLLLYASSQPAIISHYSCVKTKSANSLLRLHCFALMPTCRLLTNNWARSPRDCHQEEVISQPAIVSDYCKFFADKWPPVDVFCNHVKARKKGMGPEWNGCWDLQHNKHLQQHPTVYETFLLILMTIYDMKYSSKICIQS